MVRRLVLGMVLMGSAVVAQGLGLGDIQTRSALNQNFDADIDLLSVQTGEIDGVRVTLASADAFKRAGVDRPFFLSKLHFKPVRLPDGRAVIRISTDQPVQEPFLDFLVEVNWPNGRLLREYTVLLDPPTFTNRRAAPVQAAVSSTAPSYTAPTPAPRQARPVPRPAAVDEYGPIRADETLWSIAKGVRPRGVTMEQMMIALQKANPHAFVRGNINLLKKGQMLRVPARDEILAINRAEAKQAYLNQRDAWMAEQGKQPKPTLSKTTPKAAVAADDEGGRLQLATPRPKGEGQAGPAEGGAPSGNVEELSTDLLIARENAETARQESEHLRSQVEELEMNLRNMDRLIQLKDNQLARLQSTMAAEPTTSAELETTGEAAVSPAAVEAAGATAEAVGEESAASAALAEEPMPEAAATAAVAEGAAETAAEMETETEAMASAETTPAAAAPAEPEAATAKPAEPEAATVKPEEGLQALLGNRNVLLGAGAAIIALLAGLLFFASRRRKEDIEGPAAEDMGESILQEPEPDESAGEAMSAAGADSSFLNEFSPSDVQALNDDSAEVDPIAEADVYIAYGRYQQAEELLKQALSKEPGRNELKFKMLDVLYARPDVAGFVALAKEMAMAGIDSSEPDNWGRVRTMGQELAPDEPLFSGGAVESAEDSVLQGGEDTISMMDDDLHLSELADLAEDESTFVDELEGKSPILADLDLTNAEQGAAADELSELESLNLDLEDIESPTTTALDADAAKAETKGLGLAGDADSSLASLDEASQSQDEDLAIDDMDVFSELTEELSQLEEASTLLDEPVDLNATPAEDELDVALDSRPDDAESLASGLAEADEVETKLDLARAYIEMGDKDGAVGLLNEVKEEGNPQQASTAEELLGGLAKN